MGVGVGVGRFVINDCWKRGGAFYLFFNLLDLIEGLTVWMVNGIYGIYTVFGVF